MTLVIRLASFFAAGGDARSSRDRTTARVEDPAARAAERSFVDQIRAGNRVAFADLMELHFPSAVRFAGGFIHDQTAAEDIAQDVFVAIWEIHRTWRPNTSVRAYVLGAVRNRALNVLKHSNVESRYRDTAFVDDRIHDDVQDRLEHAAEIAALRRAVDGLPERRRAALELRYEHNMTHAEVGAALGITPKAARELVARTLEALAIPLNAFR